MKNIDLVKKYLEIFFESKEFDSLELLFDKQLDFSGPFFEFSTASEYIESLKASPPVSVRYKIVEKFCNRNSICIIYRFYKGSKNTLMSQSFWFSEGRINKIRLIFNPGEIT